MVTTSVVGREGWGWGWWGSEGGWGKRLQPAAWPRPASADTPAAAAAAGRPPHGRPRKEERRATPQAGGVQLPRGALCRVGGGGDRRGRRGPPTPCARAGAATDAAAAEGAAAATKGTVTHAHATAGGGRQAMGTRPRGKRGKGQKGGGGTSEGKGKRAPAAASGQAEDDGVAMR